MCFFFLIFIFICLFRLNCGMQGLWSSLQHSGSFIAAFELLVGSSSMTRGRIKPRPRALGVQSLSQWTTREVPGCFFWSFLYPDTEYSNLLAPTNRKSSIKGQMFGEGNATHSSTLAWKIPRMEEHGRLQPMGSQSRTRWSNFTFTFKALQITDSSTVEPEKGGSNRDNGFRISVLIRAVRSRWNGVCFRRWCLRAPGTTLVGVAHFLPQLSLRADKSSGLSWYWQLLNVSIFFSDHLTADLHFHSSCCWFAGDEWSGFHLPENVTFFCPYYYFCCCVVQLLSRIWFFEVLWTAAHQASLSFTVSWSLLRLLFIESVMLSNDLLDTEY